MKLRIGESIADNEKRTGQWHRWFAWYPVFIKTGDTRWLEYIERRRDFFLWEPLPWQYRPIAADSASVVEITHE